MQNMNELMDYCSVDVEYDQYMNTFKKNDTYKSMQKLSKFIKDGQKVLTSKEEEIKKTQENIANIEKQNKKISANIEELNKDISYFTECDDEEISEGHISQLIKDAKNNMHQANRLKDSLAQSQKELETFDSEISELMGKLKNAVKKFNELKQVYEKEMSSSPEEKLVLEQKVKEARSKIEPNILEEYDRIKGFRENPVAVLENNKCKGCNMQLPASVTSEVLKGTKIVTCENCRRILVIL